jgi:polyhydroxyalkanoic acid synthase PhaR subunit
MSERSEAPDQKDLFALWRQLYDANEKVWSQATGEFMDSPAFAQWQGKMLETFLSFQKAWKDSATAQLEAANIATREDLVRLGELIVGLEEKVDQLADRLGTAPVAPARRARTVPNPRRAPTRSKPQKRGPR